jgi:hypothetical protein
LTGRDDPRLLFDVFLQAVAQGTTRSAFVLAKVSESLQVKALAIDRPNRNRYQFVLDGFGFELDSIGDYRLQRRGR